MNRWMKSLVCRSLPVAASVVCVLGVAGCRCGETAGVAPAPSVPQPQPQPQPMKKAISGGCPSVAQRGGKSVVTQTFPTGAARSSLVMLESTSPSEGAVGQTFDYTLDVSNLTDCPLYEVEVTEHLTEQFELEASNPQAQIRGDTAMWDLGTLSPRETKTITVRMLCNEAGDFEHCATVDYELRMCQSMRIVSPELEITKTLPEKALPCDTIPMTIEVANTGTGTIRAVAVRDALPDGLRTVGGQQEVSFTIPQLTAGQKVRRNVGLKAERTGVFTNTAVAESESGLKDEATATINVQQPVLAVTKRATDTQFAGRMVDYRIVVSNRGDAVAENVEVVDELPEGVVFKSAGNNGMYDDKSNQIRWSIGPLKPGQRRTVKATVRAMEQGIKQNNVSVAAACADPVQTSAVTHVVGVPAVLLEVIDIEDPIEVGDAETYRITVTNQGTALDTNIVISCTLDDAQSLVAAGGQTPVKESSGKTVEFEPLAELGAKQRATWTVRVKADSAADARFAVEMTTNQLGNRPVNETEATNQY